MTLSYFFTKNGKPVDDLEPYIAAEMHVAIISTDLEQFIHEHGMSPGMKATEKEMQHMMMHGTIPERPDYAQGQSASHPFYGRRAVE